MNIKIDKLLFIGCINAYYIYDIRLFFYIGVIVFSVLIVSSLLTLFALFNNNIKNNGYWFFYFYINVFFI